MKIAMVAAHACVRVQKIAIPLIERGHEVSLISQKIPSFADQYDTICECPTARQFLKAIEVYAKHVDIFHCHNEPSWFVTAIKEITDKPVILDVHDTYLTRLKPDEETELQKKGHRPLRVSFEERNNFQLADGLVFVSDPFKEIIINEFKLSQPNITLPSFLPDFLYQYQAKRRNWIGGLVYEGRVDLPGETKEGSTQHGFRYCDYIKLAKQARGIGIDFHLYSGRVLETDVEFFDAYKDFAILHTGRSYSHLMESIGRHDWGLVGNIDPTPQWEIALPNKFFEYIAAAVPIVAINAGHCAEWIEKYGIGIVVKDLHELAERWSEHTEMRKRLIRVRREFIMQKHIGKMEDFYGKFVR